VYLAIFSCILNSITNHPPFTRSSSASSMSTNFPTTSSERKDLLLSMMTRYIKPGSKKQNTSIEENSLLPVDKPLKFPPVSKEEKGSLVDEGYAPVKANDESLS
jgi:hypothetical protein